MKYNLKSYFLKNKVRAFTLVELIVVIGLFSSIATVTLGTLFNAQAINVRLQQTQSVLDNFNLSIQTVARDIRFGSDFYGTSTIPSAEVPTPTKRRSCATGCSVLVLKPSDASSTLDRVVYSVTNGILYKTTYFVGDPKKVLQMTTDEITIDNMTFYVKGAQSVSGTNDDGNATDYEQPLITLLISGHSNQAQGVNRAPVTISIETNISARELDIK